MCIDFTSRHESRAAEICRKSEVADARYFDVLERQSMYLLCILSIRSDVAWIALSHVKDGQSTTLFRKSRSATYMLLTSYDRRWIHTRHTAYSTVLCCPGDHPGSVNILSLSRASHRSTSCYHQHETRLMLLQRKSIQCSACANNHRQ